MKHTPRVTKSRIKKLLSVIDAGLVKGVGKPVAGEMCVEAAVCFALDLPHGDDPKCVGSAVRTFKITLNDCEWSSNAARANGMRKLAVAQLGSDILDQTEFGKLNFLRGVQKLLPFVLRKCADDPEVKSEHKAEFMEFANKCELVESFEQAREVAQKTCAYASAYAFAFAYAFAYDSAYASSYAWFQSNLGDEFLTMIAEVGLGVLIEMKAPGCKWLPMCEVEK